MSISGNVLITGCGTLTKAILTVAHRESWDATFTVYSRSELTQSQVRAKFPHVRYVIGDVRDYSRLEGAIAGHDIVVHGAAMKRIPECEAQPDECWKTNVLGSSNVARACNAQGVTRCVGISTDKACRATTAYGASKLMLEKIFRAQSGSCIFTLVRYGNVVASRGSVVELWRKQAALNGEITITNPHMTRFWMSPFDAVGLVEDALTLEQGECLVPRLGSLSIAELASIVAPNATQVITGLRSQEKEHEDLIHTDERSMKCNSEYEEWVLSENGTLGYSFDSLDAPALATDEFLSMLRDAESLE